VPRWWIGAVGCWMVCSSNPFQFLRLVLWTLTHPKTQTHKTCQTAAAAPKRMLCLSFIMWGPFGAWLCLCFDSILRHWINYIFGRHVSRIPCVIDADFWCKGHDFWLGPAGEVYLLHYKYSIAIKMIIAMECKFKCNRFKDNFWALILG